MAFKIEVKDRVPTYPGRVVLTPVSGEANTFDMTRADLPLEEGTPVNKTLFDSKADRLTEDVTVYVSATGSDINGDGNSDAPFATIQKAIDSLPKNLDGHRAEISIGYKVYNERIKVEGFCGGRLAIGKPGEDFTINGIEVINSSFVESNIAKIQRDTGSNLPLFAVKDGSKVIIGSNITMDGKNADVYGIVAENGSHVVTANNKTITCNNCSMAVSATWCSFVSISTITGSGNTFGLSATQGAIVSYKTDTLSKMWSNNADSGGLVLTGKNSSDLSDATLDL